MKLSIITINLNDKAGLERTINSVMAQGVPDMELVVVDGLSTDGSAELLQNYGQRLNYISEKDKGIYDAMNKGIQRSTGEFLLFLNSGDHLFEKNTLQKVLPHLKPAYDIVYGNMKIAEDRQLRDGFMPDTISLAQMMNDTLWHPVSFIRKRLFDDLGLYDTSYKICGDYDFFFKAIITKKARTHHLDQFISVFDLNGMSSDPRNVAQIKVEREKAQHNYLSDEEIAAFSQQEKKKRASNFFTRWFR